MDELNTTNIFRAADEKQMDANAAGSLRRRFLTVTTTVVGLAGASVATWPFLASWNPSERTKLIGGSLRINVGAIAAGTQITVIWQGKPVWILRRTSEMMGKLTHQHLIEKLADPDSEISSQQPDYARNPLRSINPEFLVVVAVCTHLGCVPLFKPNALAEVNENGWMGGYYCPCHKSKFDLAGRVYKFVPAPTNLVIPPHHYLDSTTLVIGADRMKQVGQKNSTLNQLS